jgi:AcrR family transcriptional regulator
MSYSADTRDTRVLPRGRHAASREVVWESQRERLLAAMADAVAEKGYARVAVADVIGRAGVSRKTFYEQFANKEECFLAAYEAGVELLMAGIDEAIQAAAPDWIGAAQAGTTAYLDMLAANPSLARTFLIEVQAAGPSALARRAEVHARFARQLADAHAAARRDLPALPDLPPYVFRACVGAINELVTDRLTTAGAEALSDLERPVLDIQVKLLLGGVELG